MPISLLSFRLMIDDNLFVVNVPFNELARISAASSSASSSKYRDKASLSTSEGFLSALRARKRAVGEENRGILCRRATVPMK